MKLLLDAHAFIWLDDGQQKLSPAATKACTDRANALWLSAATLWEIQIKQRPGVQVVPSAGDLVTRACPLRSHRMEFIHTRHGVLEPHQSWIAQTFFKLYHYEMPVVDRP